MIGLYTLTFYHISSLGTIDSKLLDYRSMPRLIISDTFNVKPEVITGNEGFIGSHLYKAVKKKHGPIFCYDIKSGYDITDNSIMLPKGIGCFYHLAAIASVPECERNPARCGEVNDRGTKAMLEAAKQVGYETFILSSSAAVYGLKESICLETDEPAPLGPYGESKMMAEEYILKDKNTVALRLFNVYGIGGRGVVNIFIDRAMDERPLEITGDGTQTRDFVHVSDVCEAFLSARGKEGIFNIGCGVPITMNELAELIIDVTKSDSKIKYVPPAGGDIKHSCSDISKAGDVLGWSPKIDLEEGIRSIVKWKTRLLLEQER